MNKSYKSILRSILLFGIISSLSRFSLASEVEGQRYLSREHPFKKDENISELLETAQELWLREAYDTSVKQVLLVKKMIEIAARDNTIWISVDGEMTDKPISIKLEETISFQSSEVCCALKINRKQDGVLLNFFDKESRPVGFVKLFMLKKRVSKEKKRIFY